MIRLGIFLLFFLSFSTYSQDTLKLTLPEAESFFLKNNASILAQKYNIDAAKAQIIQVKLWDNPTFSGEQQLYNQQTKVPIPLGDLGQRAVQIQQLFLLAGKRNKRIALEKINVEASEYNYYDLLRTIAADLRTNFYDIYFIVKSVQMYDEEIQTFHQLATAYEEQYKKGNIPLKEVIRLKAFLFTLKKEQNEFRQQIIEKQSVLRVILNIKENTFIYPKINEKSLDSLKINNWSLEQLTSIAFENRFDLKTQDAALRYEQANLVLQKALATPDLRIGYSYDRNGSYIPNYHAVTVQMDLPFFNKNQGNIKSSESRIEAAKKNLEQAQIGLQSDVLRALMKAQENDRLSQSIDSKFIVSFDTLIEGAVASYQKRNISLIEFVDFVESYKNSVVELNSLKSNRIKSIEELNFVVGKKIL
jgi:outer membrane protein, heavy metal efflux system